MTDFEMKIYEIVRHVPKGKVATYGQIAKLAGNVHFSRVVGNVMHKNPLPFWQLAKSVGFADYARFEKCSLKDFEPVPCHRVVNGEGKMGANFGMGGPEIQEEMLKREGVSVKNGKVDLREYQFEDEYELKDGFELKVITIKEAVEKNLHFRSEDLFKLVMIARDTNVLQLLSGQTSEPSRQMAEYLLDEGAKMNPGPWKEHSLAVGKAAEKVAKAVTENGGNLNPDRAYVYGLLHDIGRRFGFTFMAHVIDGYEYLHNMGFENAAKICITHSFNLHTTDDYIGKRDLSEEKQNKIKNLLASYEYDDYDRLIQLLDSTCGADGTQSLELRMGDVKKRYGSYPEGKWNKNFELKDYFEKLMGQDFYQVIRN